ncbi:MAG: glycosyltransferase family 2 protein [Proteobacteria bacterium]|nr:glycosyltransferase family 2 protein [Pseudomonadota bacterium]
MDNNLKISIIIPVYNERDSIISVIEEVLKQNVYEVIVVDDGSKDGTVEVLKNYYNPKVKIFFKSKNEGKGSAVRLGLKEVKGDVIIIQDADLEYDPEEYERLLIPIKKGKADVVYGSRFKGTTRVFYFWHYVGNKFLTLIANILYNSTLSDMETCYKVFKRECVEDLDLKSKGWGFDPEITAHFFKKGYRIVEVPISYYGRTYEEGKKIKWKHGFVVLWTILKCRFF